MAIFAACYRCVVLLSREKSPFWSLVKTRSRVTSSTFIKLCVNWSTSITAVNRLPKVYYIVTLTQHVSFCIHYIPLLSPLQLFTLWVCIPLTYCFSFVFTNSLAAFGTMIIFYYFIGFVSPYYASHAVHLASILASLS